MSKEKGYPLLVVSAGLAGGVMSTVIACGASSPSPSPAERSVSASTASPTTTPTPETTLTGGVIKKHVAQPKVGKVALTKDNFCAWSPSNPEPLVSRNPLVAQVDGRCSFPDTSDVVGVYATASHASKLLFKLHSGSVVKLDCETTGQPIGDTRDYESPKWEKITVTSNHSDIGFLPQFATGYDSAAATC